MLWNTVLSPVSKYISDKKRNFKATFFSGKHLSQIENSKIKGNIYEKIACIAGYWIDNDGVRVM